MDIQSNDKLANILSDMAREFRKDRYRKRAYENAASAIRRHDKPISSGLQAQKEIKGIGKSIGAKIDEIIATGKLEFLEQRPEEKKKKEQVTKEFEKIYGVGSVTAEKWYDMGYHTFESLAELYPSMTDAQKLGYYYYNQLDERIPRSEMDQIAETISRLWSSMGVVYEIAGSYRRGEPTSGDIDILIKQTPNTDINKLLTPLIQNKLIIGNLAVGPTKYMGIMKLGDNYNARRIDMRLVTDEAWPYALLYFTGSKQLNVDMRAKAISMGMTMNEYGMVGQDGTLYPAKTEKDIFNYLGMRYLLPSERSVIFKTTKPPDGGLVSAKAPDKKYSGKWHRPVPSLFLYLSDGIESTGNIAAFDMDWTLARTVQGAWPKSPSDIELLPNRISTLKQLRDKGYTIVVFTNQKSTTDNKINFNYQRVNNFVQLVSEIPIILMMAISDDKYRKPNPGMWETLVRMIPPIKLAFYCGDAAGRPQDFSDSDRKFAENIGIPFYFPEQIFPPTERLKPSPVQAVNKIELPPNPVMAIFVGMPGAGKTTYYQNILKPLGYVHINQDLLGTKAKVLRVARENIEKGLNIVIDATNPGQRRRQEFYDLAFRYGYNLVVIYFVRDGRGFNKLRHNPVPTIAYSMYYKYLVEPTPENTPGWLYQIG
jgi:DNA polymerase beta